MRVIIARMSNRNLGDELVWREWDEAWTHSRHLESMRSQYLGFFFTALLAVTAVIASRVVKDALHSPGSLLAFAGLVLGLDALAAFLYLAVVRINEVRWYYDQIIFKIREEIGSNYSTPVDLTSLRLPPVPPRGRVSTVAKTVLGTAVVGCPIALIAAVVRAATVDPVSGLTVAICCVAVVFSLTIAGLVVWAMKPDSSIDYKSEKSG